MSHPPRVVEAASAESVDAVLKEAGRYPSPACANTAAVQAGAVHIDIAKDLPA